MSLTGLDDGSIPLFLSDKEHVVLGEIAKRKDMSHQNVMRMALRWLQVLEETPGAYDAVNALRPKLGETYGCMGDD